MVIYFYHVALCFLLVQFFFVSFSLILIIRIISDIESPVLAKLELQFYFGFKTSPFTLLRSDPFFEETILFLKSLLCLFFYFFLDVDFSRVKGRGKLD